MNWLYILALISTLWGFRKGILGLRSFRSRSHPQAEISWKQMPVSTWRYETISMIAITLHSLGVIGLTAMLLISLDKNEGATMFPHLETTPLLKMLLLAFSIGGAALTSYTSGLTIAFHFTQQWIKPAGYGIRDLGISYGGLLIPWVSFSHYEIGPEDGMISLYSSYSPSLRTWVLQPPVELYTSVLGFIQKNVPKAIFADRQIPLWRSPITLLFTMAVLVFVTLIPAICGLVYNQLWVWGYAIVAFYIIQKFGNDLITRFEGRVKATDPEASSI